MQPIICHIRLRINPIPLSPRRGSDTIKNKVCERPADLANELWTGVECRRSLRLEQCEKHLVEILISPLASARTPVQLVWGRLTHERTHTRGNDHRGDDLPHVLVRLAHDSIDTERFPQLLASLHDLGPGQEDLLHNSPAPARLLRSVKFGP
jgi:hypothetical protein